MNESTAAFYSSVILSGVWAASSNKYAIPAAIVWLVFAGFLRWDSRRKNGAA